MNDEHSNVIMDNSPQVSREPGQTWLQKGNLLVCALMTHARAHAVDK